MNLSLCECKKAKLSPALAAFVKYCEINQYEISVENAIIYFENLNQEENFQNDLAYQHAIAELARLALKKSGCCKK